MNIKSYIKYHILNYDAILQFWQKAQGRYDRSTVDGLFFIKPDPTSNWFRGPCLSCFCFSCELLMLNTVRYHHMSLRNTLFFPLIFKKPHYSLTSSTKRMLLLGFFKLRLLWQTMKMEKKMIENWNNSFS